MMVWFFEIILDNLFCNDQPTIVDFSHLVLGRFWAGASGGNMFSKVDIIAWCCTTGVGIWDSFVLHRYGSGLAGPEIATVSSIGNHDGGDGGTCYTFSIDGANAERISDSWGYMMVIRRCDHPRVAIAQASVDSRKC
ncbi:hypothetical protein RIF29_30170 [Crotalaria pallida]|uniref:Uncharacterized protein n=1 Tax=Crotalaria pallida TaxID=3830 RepID=A0AAN9EFV1_CROPI